MYHDLKVDGVSLKGYKVYINGTEAYNSAERDVEFIEIPGRSGAFALDKKRFKNITVQYNSGTFAENQPEFARKISDLRNFLASRDGYVRIEDDYNPEEYRMGVFSRGLEFDPVCYNMASEFPIEFNCKPQRFLKIGDLPVSVASGDVITNPTLFDAHPLIKFNSSGADGSISIGDRNIGVLSAALGIANLDLSVQKAQTSNPLDYVVIRNTSIYNAGDPITIKGGTALFTLKNRVTSFASLNANGLSVDRRGQNLTFTASDTTFTAGTPQTITKTIDVRLTVSGTPYFDETKTFTLSIEYDGANQIAYRWTPGGYSFETYAWEESLGVYSGTVNSSKNTLEDVDIYIDLDIGEAYSIDSDDNAASLNNFINLGSELPALPPGSTTISYSNTISNVEITPHWWRV